MNTQTNIYIYESELNAILQATLASPNTETGGDLFGSFTHGSMPVIWLALGPGPKAHGGRAHFEQDVAFTSACEKWLTKNLAIQYIGSWHSHHTLGLRQPSGGDSAAARSYAINHRRERTIEIIVTLEEGKAMAWPYFYPNAQKSGWVGSNFFLLTGASPVRTHIATANETPEMRMTKQSLDATEPIVMTLSEEAMLPMQVAQNMESDGIEIPEDLEREIESIADHIVDIEQVRDLLQIRVRDISDRYFDIHIDANKLDIVEIKAVLAGSPQSVDITAIIMKANGKLRLRKRGIGILEAVIQSLGSLSDYAGPWDTHSQDSSVETGAPTSAELLIRDNAIGGATTYVYISENPNQRDSRQFDILSIVLAQEQVGALAQAFAKLSIVIDCVAQREATQETFHLTYNVPNEKKLEETLDVMQSILGNLNPVWLDANGQSIDAQQDTPVEFSHKKAEGLGSWLKRGRRGQPPR